MIKRVASAIGYLVAETRCQCMCVCATLMNEKIHI